MLIHPQAMILPFAATRKVDSTSTDGPDMELDTIFDSSDLAVPDSENIDALTREEDEYEADADRDTFDERTIEEITKEVEADDALTMHERRVARYAVTKVRQCDLHSLHPC